MNGIEHVNCKNTCRTNMCNVDAHQTKKQCYTCSGSMDLSGASAGPSDDKCWNDANLVDS